MGITPSLVLILDRNELWWSVVLGILAFDVLLAAFEGLIQRLGKRFHFSLNCVSLTWLEVI